MTTLPVRTPEERAASLVTARKNRTARAQVKRDLKAGKLSLDDLLGVGHRGVGDPIIGRLPIGQVLRAAPGWGPVKSARLLEELGVDAKRHIDTISDKHLDAILAAVES